MQISIFFKGVGVVRKKYKEILEGKEVKKKKKAKGFYFVYNIVSSMILYSFVFAYFV